MNINLFISKKNVILLFEVDIENSKRMNEEKKNMIEVGDHLNIGSVQFSCSVMSDSW